MGYGFQIFGAVSSIIIHTANDIISIPGILTRALIIFVLSNGPCWCLWKLIAFYERFIVFLYLPVIKRLR